MINTLQPVAELTSEQVTDLYQLFDGEWWTKGRELPDIEKMLAHSDVIIGFAESESGRLVAFARLITDYVYKALLLDVIVAEEYREQGLGKQLLEAVIHHPDLEGVRHIELYCLPEVAGFYKQWGFTNDLGSLSFMRRSG
jgi:predicted GNAT family N-acyltransferase